MHGKMQRQDIRLRLDSANKGVVFLRVRNIPAAACSLIELSESGCRCVAKVSSFDDSTMSRFRSHTEPGRQMPIDISAPPHLPGVHLDAEVRHATHDGNGTLELGLFFVNVDSFERELLTNALQAFAAEKLDTAHGDGTVASLEPEGAATPVTDTAPELDNAGDAEAATARAESDDLDVPVKKPWFPPSETPHKDDGYRRSRLGEILKQMGKVNDEQLSHAHSAALASSEKLGRYLLRRGWVSPIDLCSALSLQSGLPMVDLCEIAISPGLAGYFSQLTMLRHEFVPFHESGGQLCIASTNPIPPSMLTDLEQRCGRRIRVFLAEDDAVMTSLHALKPEKERKLRRQKRFKLTVPISLRCVTREQKLSGELMFAGTTMDVSETGLMLETAEDLKRRGTCMHISFSLPPQSVEAFCSIRYVKERKGSEHAAAPFVVGLQIMDMTPANRTQLKEICVRTGMWNLKDRRDAARR
jgi:hypothetical protein